MKIIIILLSFLILTVHGQSSNWKEGELNPPDNGDGYGMVEQRARALDSDEPEYQELQSSESGESSVESEESSDESTEASVESSEESSERDEIEVEMEPEVGIIGKLISRHKNYLKWQKV